MTLRAWFVAIQWVMAAAFVFSVAVQYNDPDPLPWMGIYGAAAVASAWAALRPRGYPWPFPAVVGAVALVWSFFLLPQVVGKVRLPELFASWEMKSPRVEVAREAGGLLIVAAWMAVTASIRWMIRG
jgi:transmembrane protein TMEM220